VGEASDRTRLMRQCSNHRHHKTNKRKGTQAEVKTTFIFTNKIKSQLNDVTQSTMDNMNECSTTVMCISLRLQFMSRQAHITPKSCWIEFEETKVETDYKKVQTTKESNPMYEWLIESNWMTHWHFGHVKNKTWLYASSGITVA